MWRSSHHPPPDGSNSLWWSWITSIVYPEGLSISPTTCCPSPSSHQLVLLPRLLLKHLASCPRLCCFVSSSHTGFCCSRAQTTGSVASSPAQALSFLHSALLLRLQLIHGVLLLGKDLSWGFVGHPQRSDRSQMYWHGFRRCCYWLPQAAICQSVPTRCRASERVCRWPTTCWSPRRLRYYVAFSRPWWSVPARCRASESLRVYCLLPQRCY